MPDKSILQAAHDYYNYGESNMTDAQFDAVAGSTAPLGAKPTGNFKKVTHAVPMLSLQNVHSAQETIAKLGNVEILAEPKFDGLSCSLIYKSGKLVCAATRGDGTTGDDVTENVLVIENVPHDLGHKIDIEIRGEVLLTKAKFEAINVELVATGEQPYSNARNLAAGTLKLKDSSLVAKRGLAFYAYQIVNPTKLICLFAARCDKQDSVTAILHDLGFLTSLAVFPITLADTTKGVENIIDNWTSFRPQLPFDIDGIVFKINSLKAQEDLGFTGKYPNWAVAYKFPAEQVKTTIIDIKVQIGRQGTLTPVAEVKPVNLGGVTVKRATLCNIEQVERLGINLGSEVLIQRACDVIPQITNCTNPTTPWQMPAYCPSCGTPTVKEGAHTFCHNYACPDQVKQRLIHAFSKGALDVDGCGPAIIDSLVASGCVTISDVLKRKAITANDGVNERKVLVGFNTCLNQPIWRKLYALGIELIGQTKCKDLALKYNNDVDAIFNADTTELTALLGPVAADNMVQFILRNCTELVELANLGFWTQPTANATVQSGATGKQFVITGTLMSGTREAVAATIEAHGGVVKSSVNKKLDYLIMGQEPGASKQAAATKYGIKTINEDELYALLGIPVPEVRTFGEEEL